MEYIKETPRGLLFKIFVQPRSSRNEIIGPVEDAIKIKLTAPPVDDAANRMLVKYLAKILGVPKSSLLIEKGHSSRRKTLLYCPKRRTDRDAFRASFSLLIKT